MKVLFLLALAGLACGLQPDLEYTYEYFGKADTGIPDISTQGASAALKATVRVVVKQNGHAYFRIENPMFAQYHGELGCDVRADVAYDFQEPQDPKISEILCQVYEANLYGSEDFSLRLSLDEPLWATNMRKAVTSLFKSTLLVNNFEHDKECTLLDLIRDEKIPQTFSFKEDTIFGRCNIEYTVHPVPDVIGQPRMLALSKVKVDEQFPVVKSLKITKTSKKSTKTKGKPSPSKYTNLPKIDEQLWHVVRSVDFEHCESNVFLQRSTGGVHGTPAEGQYEWISGRSAAGEYILRGSGKGFRIEMASVEGAITSNALGMTKEIMQSRTNQTLSLISVTSVHTKVPHFNPKKVVNTWLHEILTPFDTPKVAPVLPWITYTGDAEMYDHVQMVTGIPPSEESIKNKKMIVDQFVTFAATNLVSEKDHPEIEHGDITEKLLIASQIIANLPKNAVEELVEATLVENIIKRPHETMKKKLLIDVIAASGSKPAAQIIIKLVQQKRITDLQLMTLAMTLTQNLRDVTVMPELVDFVLAIDHKEKPFLASTILVNFANAFHHLCVAPDAAQVNYEGALYGDHTCDLTLIKDKFLPHLKNIIYNEDLTWERLTAIKALHSLQIPTTIDILAPVILGQKGSSFILRTMAIHALERWGLPMESQSHVVELLTKIYSNIAETPRVRIAALQTVASFGPKTNFWHTIARLSWREPSTAMASAYTSLITAYATNTHVLFKSQNQAASHALKFARPAIQSTKFPFMAKDIRNVYDRHATRVAEMAFAMFDYPMQNANFDFYYFLMNSFNGYSMTSLDLVLQAGILGEMHPTPTKSYDDKGTVHHQVANEFYKKIQDVIKSVPIQTPDKRVLSVYVRFLEHMIAYLPISTETSKTLPYSDSLYLGSLMIELQAGMSRVYGKFFTPMTLRHLLPNAIGLPVLVQHTGSIVMADKMYAQVAINKDSKKAHVDMENFFRFESSSSGSMNILLPWSDSMLTTTLKSARDVTLPFAIDVSVEMPTKKLPSKVEFSVKPLFETEFTVMGATAIPSTAISPMTLNKDPRAPVTKPILKHASIHETHQLPKTYAGLDLKVQWDSQFRYPLDMFGMNRFYSRMHDLKADPKLYYLLSSPTAQMWSVDLKLNPSKSETKNMTVGFSCQAYAPEPYVKPGQTSQTSGQMDYSQEPFEQEVGQEQSFDDDSHEFKEFGQDTESAEVFNHKINKPTKEKIRERYGGSLTSCSFKLNFHGTKNREYEVLYSWAKPNYANQRRQRKSQLSFFRSAIPGLDSKPLSVCLDSMKTTPAFSDLDTAENVLNREDLHSEIIREVTVGCKGNPVVKSETKMELSDAGIESLKKTLHSSCDYDKFHSLESIYDLAVYDNVHSKISWENVCDKARLPLLSKSISMLERTFTKSFQFMDCDHDDKPNHLELSAHRNAETELWTYESKRGEDDVFTIPNVPSCPVSEFLFSVGSVVNPIAQQKHINAHGRMSERCSVGTEEVRSFDGNVFHYEASQCWTVAASNCFDQSWVVLTRAPSTESDVPEVRIIDRVLGSVIDIDTKVKVNGKLVEFQDSKAKVYSSEDLLVAKVYTQDGHFMVKIPGRLIVTVKDRAEIKLLGKQNVCGLCGDHNNEREAEFIGPHHCMYTDANTFAASWTAGGETCNLYTQIDKRSKAEEFQKSCATFYELAKQSSLMYPVVDFHYVFSIYQEHDLVCTTQWTHAQCRAGCRAYKQDDVSVELKCWNKDHAPSKLTTAIQNGEHELLEPVSEQPQERIHRSIKVARKCTTN